MRNTFLTIIAGTNGTGKSSIIREKFIPMELNNQKGRVLIVVPDANEWTQIQELNSIGEISTFEGIRRVIYEEGLFHILSQNFSDGLLIFDDFRSYIFTKSLETKALKYFAIRRRQRMIDLIIVVHGITEIVPNFLLTYATHIIMFNTLDNIVTKKPYLSDYESILKTQKEVNSMVGKKIKGYISYNKIVTRRDLKIP